MLLSHYRIIYFKGNKFNSYIPTDIAQIWPCIVELKTFYLTQKNKIKRTELESQMDLLAVGLKQLYGTKTISHNILVSEFKFLGFFFLSFASNFWRLVVTGQE